MNYNIFSFLLLSLCFVSLGCNNSYNMIKNGANEPDKPISEETKTDFPKTCTCSLCKSDYKYFYLCSHGSIITVCNECGAIYDPVYEAGLSNDEHNLDISSCFKEECAPATMKNLEDAGLKDLVNKFGLLEDEEF